eukprot:CAMPEP_0167750518 /NCGR_PEP_ID=MMETSP0110_2-20121227/6042_1 /TAXON_ID=629695 /ORGANISM="Gymnochlora sp., Strain CCMP2014" /LENGTH=1365 /DNA_ID=CAMNT_0007635861 /DNA_START=143 /DNA_END=4240 /DNA_ORIENTATION=-
MGKRRRMRSDSRSDSEEVIRKKKKRKDRKRDRGRDRDRDRDRDKQSKHSHEERRKSEGGEKKRRNEKENSKQTDEERLLEERRQRLKLWKARKGIQSDGKKLEPSAPTPTAAASSSSASAEVKKPVNDKIAAKIAAIKAKLAAKKKAKEAEAKAKAAAMAAKAMSAVQSAESTSEVATPEEKTSVKKEEEQKAETVPMDTNESTNKLVKQENKSMDVEAAVKSEEKPEKGGMEFGTPAPVAPKKVPKLKQPKKWIPATYELIGTEEFEGAPFMGVFVEDKELKGRVFKEKKGKLFLYYWRPKRQWIIGDNYSSELGLVFVDTLARSPDQIARPWSFFDGETGEWVTTEDLLLRRLPSKKEAEAWAKTREPICVEMKGPESFEGAPFMGIYKELIGFQPPVYKHEKNDFFLYYWKMKKQWIVGRDWKTDQGPFMFVESEAVSPDRVHTYWNYWDPEKQAWDYDEDIWCPKVGTKTVDENAEQDIDAKAAVEAVTRQAVGASKDDMKSDKKLDEKQQDKVSGVKDEKVTEKIEKKDENDMEIEEKSIDAGKEDKKVKQEEGGDEKALVKSESKDESKKESEAVDTDDPLEMFMSKLGSAKTDEEKNAAVGIKKRKKHAKAVEEAKKVKQGDLYESEDNILDEKQLARRAKEMKSWLEKNKPKLKDLKPVDHSKMNYEPFRKKFYIESPEISAMTADEVKLMCKKELDNVRIRGKNCPKPIKKWVHCGLPKKIYRTLERLAYKKPFAIQATAIPAIMSGRDVIGIAKTGSGKTLAFLLPMFRHIMDQRPLEKDEGPMAVILAPTRELAIQIHLEARKFAKPLGVRPVCVYGGTSVAEQIAELKRGAEIVTGTPGRMIDLLCANSGRVTNLTRVTYLVLDEADRMFDLGFEPQIMRVVQNVRPGRQTVMFSATFPRIVEKLAKVCMKQPIEIMIGGRSVATDNVTQFVEVRDPDSRFKRLLEILGQWYSRGSVLVFANKKDDVDFLYTKLIDAGYPCISVHGDMDQTDRDYAIMDFRNGLHTLMIATSVLSRGLDVKDLVLVINYDAPTHYEDYVHRIGRTGRAGKKGTAITFLNDDEEQLALDLVTGLEKNKQIVPKDLQKLADEFKAKVSRGEAVYYSNKGYDGRGHKFDEEEAQAQLNEKRWERIGYGVEEKTEADYMLEEEKRKEEEKKKLEKAAKAADSVNPIKAQLEAAKRAAKAASQVLKSNKVEDGNKLMAAKVAAKKVLNDSNIPAVGAKAKAAAYAAHLQLSLRAQGQQGAGDFCTEEIEINDYPQYARYKMTQRSVVADIEERFECTITTKGTYIPPGRKIKDGQKKLWLQIEGKTQVDVLRCKADIRRTLDEAASMRPDSNERRSGGGKYQVLSITY